MKRIVAILVMLCFWASLCGEAQVTVVGSARHRKVFAVALPPGPDTISGLNLWYSADCISMTGSSCNAAPSNGSTIGTWVDRVSKTNATAVGTCTFHASAINGRPSVVFPGTCYYSIPSATSPSYATVAAVYVNSNCGSYEIIGAAYAGFAYWTGKGGGKQQGFDLQGLAQRGTGTANCTTVWHQSNLNTGPSAGFRLDGATDGTTSTQSFSGGSQPNTIGANGDNHSEVMSGEMAEIVYWPRDLTGAEITQVEAYFHAKYGL